LVNSGPPSIRMQQPDTFIVPYRLNVDPDLFGQFTDFHAAFLSLH